MRTHRQQLSGHTANCQPADATAQRDDGKSSWPSPYWLKLGLVALLGLWLAGCRIPPTSLGDDIRITPREFYGEVEPNQQYRFVFAVTDKQSKQPLTESHALVTLELADGDATELFSGQPDAHGELTFTVQTPLQQEDGVALLHIQVYQAAKVARYDALIHLRPSLSIDLIQPIHEVAPGAQALITAQVYDRVHAIPATNSAFQAVLILADGGELTLFDGQTDRNGQVEFLLHAPVDLPLRPVTLILRAQAAAGLAEHSVELAVAPPVSIRPVALPDAIFAGQPVTFTLEVYDRINRTPAAGSDVQAYVYDFMNGTNTLRFDGQTDANGFATFTVSAPPAEYQSSLVLTVYAQSFEGEADYQATFTLQAPLTIEAIGLPRRMSPGANADLLLRVWDNIHHAPAAGVAISGLLTAERASLRQPIEGVTDADGLLRAPLTAPELAPELADDNMAIVVNASAATGAATANYWIPVAHNYALLITTDKPVYQPGQTLHIRLLALDNNTNQAIANQALQLTVRDHRGNQLRQTALTTSHFGVATLDFELAEGATSGDYTIEAVMTGAYAMRSVEVKPYVLPRFKITAVAAQPYYRPGATATGVVTATYFFGKPVAGGRVVIRGYAPVSPNSTQERQFIRLEGQLDEAGRYPYELLLPDVLHDKLVNRTSEVRLEIDVVDPGEQLEQSEATITLAEQPFLIEAAPESGLLKPGLANLIYLQVSTPDGAAAQAELEVTFGAEGATPILLQSDAFGLATLVVTPTRQSKQPLQIRYTAGGELYTARLDLAVDVKETVALLLRPASAEAPVGGPLLFDVWASGAPTVTAAATIFIEIQKADQPLAVIPVHLKDGHGRAALSLPRQLVGTLSMSAHLQLDAQRQVSDYRLVLVNAEAAQVQLTLDAEVYRPGETAHLTIEASHDGQPLQGVIGLNIVDESVYALRETLEPGFARTYFLLDRELLAARYGLHDFAELGDLGSPYDTFAGNAAARHPAQEVQSYTRAPLSAGLEKARATALMGLLAHTLSTAQQAPNPDEQAGAPPPAAEGRGWAGWTMLILMGALLYVGHGKRPTSWMLVLVLGAGALVWTACAAPAPIPGGPAGGPPVGPPGGPPVLTAERSIGAAAPRLRQFFPETLLWLPAVETDAQGQAQIDVPLADSITTWRVSVLVSDRQGNLGSAVAPLRVFQDFFVEPQLPAWLTQGDEIEVTAPIYNYLETTQTVQLTVEPAPWFELLDQEALRYPIQPNEVAIGRIPLRVTGVGAGEFTLTAQGDNMGDRVVRTVTIRYNGEQQSLVTSGRLTTSLSLTLPIPTGAIVGTPAVTVKLFPNTISQVYDSLSSPAGATCACLQEIVDETYANALLLDLLQQSGAAIDAPLAMHAARRVDKGYQRLLAFETDGQPGAFSLYYGQSGRPVLSAYLLQQLVALGRVRPVDANLTGRIIAYLNAAQQPNGSWPADQIRYYGGWEQDSARVATTAYIVWALGEAGYVNELGVQYLLAGLADQPADPYVQSLLINALLTSENGRQQANTLLTQLVAQRQTDLAGNHFWRTRLPTFVGSRAAAANAETTALAAYTLVRAGSNAEIAQSAITYLTSRRTGADQFEYTPTTILLLKTLALTAQQDQITPGATITVQVAGQEAQTIQLASARAANPFAPVILHFDQLAPTATLTMQTSGELSLPYQVVTSYVAPWAEVAATATQHLGGEPPIAIAVTYDRAELHINDPVTATATITVQLEQPPANLTVEIGLPPGFVPLPADLTALSRIRTVSDYSLAPGQLTLHLTGLQARQRYSFGLRLQAALPGLVQTPPSLVYDPYMPEVRAVAAPQQLRVFSRSE